MRLTQSPKAPESKPWSRSTRGLLKRRPVRVGSIYYVGKESNYLEEVDYGLEHNLDEVQNRYFDAREPGQFERYVRPILKYIPLRVLALETGKRERFLRAVRQGHKTAL